MSQPEIIELENLEAQPDQVNSKNSEKISLAQKFVQFFIPICFLVSLIYTIILLIINVASSGVVQTTEAQRMLPSLINSLATLEHSHLAPIARALEDNSSWIINYN